VLLLKREIHSALLGRLIDVIFKRRKSSFPFTSCRGKEWSPTEEKRGSRPAPRILKEGRIQFLHWRRRKEGGGKEKVADTRVQSIGAYQGETAPSRLSRSWILP